MIIMSRNILNDAWFRISSICVMRVGMHCQVVTVFTVTAAVIQRLPIGHLFKRKGRRVGAISVFGTSYPGLGY